MADLDTALSGHKSALDYARTMVGKQPSDADLRAYLSGEHLDPRKHEWCAAFVNASLHKAGLEGSGSTMATGFLNWGRHVEPKDVRAGDVVVMGRNKEDEWVKPKEGLKGHSAIVAGPLGVNEKGEATIPTVTGAWSHHVRETTIRAWDDIAEFRRAPPSHQARQRILEDKEKTSQHNSMLQPMSDTIDPAKGGHKKPVVPPELRDLAAPPYIDKPGMLGQDYAMPEIPGPYHNYTNSLQEYRHEGGTAQDEVFGIHEDPLPHDPHTLEKYRSKQIAPPKDIDDEEHGHSMVVDEGVFAAHRYYPGMQRYPMKAKTRIINRCIVT